MNQALGWLILVFVVDEILSEVTGMEPAWRWILER
jgi:hypothetical protein